MMRLYDTMLGDIKTLEFPDNTVNMYVCGVTPYETSHLGHAKVGVVYDTMRRFLEWTGLTVRYVQNVTDIDEPLFARAKRDGEDWRSLGDRQTALYLESLAKLNVPRPEFFVKATSMIDQILSWISRLVELGHAYSRSGTVYYSIATRPDLGVLPHLMDHSLLLGMANEMGNDPHDQNKLDPLDFVLWKPSQPGEPSWSSPWGDGRPGWHIECSTIATHYLGPQIDIHGGGTDLIFPHHACESAVAEPVTGVIPYVRAWMHIGLVTMGGEKMSKSLGNMVYVNDVLRTQTGVALRLAILNQHYRKPYEYALADVQAAEAQVTSMSTSLQVGGGSGTALHATEVSASFRAALEDDFDTPEAVRILGDFATRIEQAAATGLDVEAAQKTLRQLADVLGLLF